MGQATMNTIEILFTLREAINRQYGLITAGYAQREDENAEEFNSRLLQIAEYAHKNATACFKTSELPGIESMVQPYEDVVIGGLRIIRKCSDQLDNIYARMA